VCVCVGGGATGERRQSKSLPVPQIDAFLSVRNQTWNF